MAGIDYQHARALIDGRASTPETLRGLSDGVADIAAGVAQSLAAGGTAFACGNGGSATQATHFAAELVGRFKLDRGALRAFSLSDNPAAVTALANDYSYDEIFSRQIEGLAREGDCLLALSTSGNSPSVVRACRAARDVGVAVFGLTGASGGEMESACDLALRVPFEDTARVQEVHLMIIHVVCELVESAIFGGAAGE